MKETEVETKAPVKKPARKTKKYLAMEPIVDSDLKGAIKPLEGWTPASRMEDVDRFLNTNKVKILDRFGLDEVQIAVFHEPVIRTIRRETKVSVS